MSDFTEHLITDDETCVWSWPGCEPCTAPATDTDRRGRRVCLIHRSAERQEPELDAIIEHDHGTWLEIAILVPGRPGVVARGVVTLVALHAGPVGSAATEMSAEERRGVAGIRLRRIAVSVVDVPTGKPGILVPRGNIACQAISVDAQGVMRSMFWQSIQLWFPVPGDETDDGHQADALAAGLAKEMAAAVLTTCLSPDEVAHELLKRDVDARWLIEILAVDAQDGCSPLRPLSHALHDHVDLVVLRGHLELLSRTRGPHPCFQAGCQVGAGGHCHLGKVDPTTCPRYRMVETTISTSS
jgi:hypothetical protein